MVWSYRVFSILLFGNDSGIKKSHGESAYRKGTAQTFHRHRRCSQVLAEQEKAEIDCGLKLS